MNYLIANETKSIETMGYFKKEDELTILILQNKSRVLEKEIEVRKQLVKEYTNHIVSMSKSTYTRTKLMPVAKRPLNTNTSITQITAA